jgi:serine/threonine-protein kinase HipA
VSTVTEVILWGKSVGALLYDTGTGLSTFEYDKGWLKQDVSISPLHLPPRAGRFNFPSLPQETFFGLPGVFADTLPDDFGNAVINAWLARKGIPKSSFSPVDRLLYTGNRGMGALEYKPDGRNTQTQVSGDIKVE